MEKNLQILIETCFPLFAFVIALKIQKNSEEKMIQIISKKKKILTLNEIERILHLHSHKEKLSKKKRRLFDSIIDSYLKDEDLIEFNNDIPSTYIFESIEMGSVRKRSNSKMLQITSHTNLDLSMDRKDKNLKISENPEKLKKINFFRILSKKYLESISFNPDDFNFDLKVSYTYFLHDFMNLGKESYTQFSFLAKENENITIEKEIDRTRLQRILMGDFDLRNEKGKKNKIELKKSRLERNLNNAIEKVLRSYSKFWSSMSDSNPEISKVKNFLLLSHDSIHKLLIFWNKNEDIFMRNFYCLIMFGNFLTQILNLETEGGLKIAKGHRIMKRIAKQRNNINNFEINDDIQFISSPICLFEKRDNDMIVKSCNGQFAFLFGYRKIELIGRKIKKIINKYSFKFYCERFKHFESAAEKGLLLTKELLLFKNKNGFLRVYSASLKIIIGEKNEQYLVLKIEIRKKARLKAEILVTRSGRIVAHNESTMNIFGLKEIIMKDNGVRYLGELASEFDEINFYEFVDGKKLTIVNLKTGKILDLYIKVKKPRDCRNTFLFDIWKLRDIKPIYLSEDALKRTMKSFEQRELEELKFKVYMKSKSLKKDFIWTFTENCQFKGAYYTPEEIEKLLINLDGRLIKKQLYTTSMILDKAVSFPKRLGQNLKMAFRRDYAKGIRVRRLVEGQLLDIGEIDEIDSEFLSEIEMSQAGNKKFGFNSFAQKMKQLDNDDSPKSTVKNILREEKGKNIWSESQWTKIEKYLKGEVNSKNLKWLKIFNIFLLIFSFGVFGFDWYRIQNMISNLEYYIRIDVYHPLRNENIKLMHHRTFELALTNQGILPYFAYRDLYNKQTFLEETYGYILRDTEETMRFQRDVLDFYSKVKAYPELHKLLNRRWTMLIVENKVVNVSFVDFFEMARTHVAMMDKYNLEDLKFGTPEVDFIEKNFLQRVTKGTKDLLYATLDLKEELRESFIELKNTSLIILLVRSIIAAVVIIFLQSRVIKEKEKILKYYFSFRGAYISFMLKKCDLFLHDIETKDLDKKDFSVVDTDSIDRDYKESREKMRKENEEARRFFSMKRKKKVKGTMNKYFNFFNFFIVVIMWLNYFMVSKDLDFYDTVSIYMKNMANALLHLGMSLNRYHFFALSLYSAMIDPAQGFFGVETIKYFNSTSKELSNRFEKSMDVIFFFNFSF